MVPESPGSARRRAAIAALSSRLPSKEGDPWFDEVLCEGLLHRPGFDLPSQLPCWAIAESGCTDSRLVFRGANRAWNTADKLVSGAHRLSCWTAWDLGMEPLPGDVLVLGDRRRGEPAAPCVFVRSDGHLWVTAATGLCGRTGAPRAAESFRTLRGDSLEDGDRRRSTILGWVDLDRAPYDRAA